MSEQNHFVTYKEPGGFVIKLMAFNGTRLPSDQRRCQCVGTSAVRSPPS